MTGFKKGLAARPTAAYDEQWGKVPTWSANDFVPIVYYELGGGSRHDTEQ